MVCVIYYIIIWYAGSDKGIHLEYTYNRNRSTHSEKKVIEKFVAVTITFIQGCHGGAVGKGLDCQSCCWQIESQSCQVD